jgi:translation initiation factor IF-3
MPQGKHIKHKIVWYQDPETGKLTERNLQDLLASLDSTRTVQLVTVEPKPIVKIMQKGHRGNLNERRDRIKTKSKPPEHKEFQFTWSMGSRDFEHKLAKAREELAKGGIVDIVIASKPKQPWPPSREMEQKLDGIASGLSDVARERSHRETRNGIGALFLMGIKTTKPS